MPAKNDIINEWYLIKNIDTIDSPALVIYHDRVVKNISTVISMIDDINRLRPHVKTHKSIEITRLLAAAGIHKFKCATIAEAEMLGMANAKDVLLAYQPGGPKLKRFIALIKKFPGTSFSCLIDNDQSANDIASAAVENHLTIKVYLDLNVGMNRTGITPGKAFELYKQCFKRNGLALMGLHAYDGHIHAEDHEERKTQSDKAFGEVSTLQQNLVAEGLPEPVIVAGGSPTFPIHARRQKIECSPGTFIFWDHGYKKFKEQHFFPAALVITRVISLPSENTLCLDLGHKSIAAENNVSNRVYFLNAPGLKLISQSEEHAVVEVPANHVFKIGDVLYGLPVHICPTVALYQSVFVVKHNLASAEWQITARDRKIII